MANLYPVALHRLLPTAKQLNGEKDTAPQTTDSQGQTDPERVKMPAIPMSTQKIASMSVIAVDLWVCSPDGVPGLPTVGDMPLLHTLFGLFDEAAHEVEAEKMRTEYFRYYAMAGAPMPYLGSHTTAMVVLGLNVINVVKRHNSISDGPKLLIKVGVGSGAAVGV